MSRLRHILGRNLRLARNRLRLSQEVLAGESGVDRTYVSGIERGLRNPSVDLIEKLAGALGVSPADLITDPAPASLREVAPEADERR
ncbi:MAG: helix-turn-helix transcriptional regulator [Salinarimonas sp.]|nr:helix-turn-helix transcriptional regulator [Salinarimonas sp.]